MSAASRPSPGPSLPIRGAPTDQKGVDYLVTLSGSGIELGVAWKKTSAKGKDYVSVKLDSPFLPAPANYALVKQADGYALIWNFKSASDACACEVRFTVANAPPRR